MPRSGCATPGASALHPRARSRGLRRRKAWPRGRFKRSSPAGTSTDTLPDADALHLPLVAGDRAEGVLAVHLTRVPTIEQRELLDAFAAQLAVFVNKERALDKAARRNSHAQSEQLQKTLVRLRLARIENTAGRDLRGSCTSRSRSRRIAASGATAHEHSRSSTRCDAARVGPAPPAREWCDPGELLREAVEMAGLEDRQVRINVATALPEISVDPR